MNYWEEWKCPVHGVYGKDWTPEKPGPNGICWTVIKCSIECPRGKGCVYCGHRFDANGSNGWAA